MSIKNNQQKSANQIELFDVHCHLDFPEFNEDRNKLYDIAQENGLLGLIIPGVKREGWRFVRQLAALMPGVHAALGIHPRFIHEHSAKDLHDLELAMSIGPLVAVGEIGLDYQNGRADQSQQEKFFHDQLHMAKDANLPVVLHVLKAHEDVLKQLRMLNFNNGGIVHAYNGDITQAKRYADHGFKMGFGGAITFPRAARLRSLVSELPLDYLVVETDAPDMPPVSCKTSRNTPVHIFDNFRAMCSLRSETPVEIATQTTKNAFEVFNINSNEV